MTVTGLLLGLAACTPLPLDDYQSLRRGQVKANECMERLHHGTAESFSECLRYVAAHPPQEEPQPSWWALGVLQFGWLIHDVLSQSGLEDADRESRALLAEAEVLRLQLSVSPATLCPLVDIPCTLQAQRRRERLAGR